MRPGASPYGEAHPYFYPALPSTPAHRSISIIMASTAPEAPPPTNPDDVKHSTIAQAGLGTRLTHLSRPSGHCFVNPPVQRGSTVLFPTVKERNASWFDRKRFEQALTYGINGSEVRFCWEGFVAPAALFAFLHSTSPARSPPIPCLLSSSFPPFPFLPPSLPPHRPTTCSKT